jgi:histone deacetylase 1/2
LYPDSGATHHVTPDANATNLMDVASLSGSDQVHIGTGQGLSITFVGSMSFSSPFYPHTTLKLNNLLHVPSITKKLVSVSQFARDNNVYFEFHPNECFVKSQGSSKLLLRGYLGIDGLYQFDSPIQLKAGASASIPSKPTTHSISQANNGLSLGSDFSSSSIFNFQCNNVESVIMLKLMVVVNFAPSHSF